MLDVMVGNNRSEINEQLALFKERNVIQFGLVLRIPRAERIPELVKQQDGRMRVSAALSASIKSAFDNINLRIGLNSDQIVELAEQIIDEATEDNLALEDVLLFLQQLISGKAGKIYDRMDIPTFFELFENYRQDRYDALRKAKHEQHIQFKTLGDNGERASDSKDREKELTRSAMSDYLRSQFKQDENK